MRGSLGVSSDVGTLEGTHLDVLAYLLQRDDLGGIIGEAQVAALLWDRVLAEEDCPPCPNWFDIICIERYDGPL